MGATLTLASRTKRPGARQNTDAGHGRAAYAADAHSWALQQAALLREGRLDLNEAQNIADEIADVAKREARATRSAICPMTQQLLKWDYQADRRSRSREQRRSIVRRLDEMPGLHGQLQMLTREAYADARDAALEQTDLSESVLPVDCAYSWDDITSRPIEWPE